MSELDSSHTFTPLSGQGLFSFAFNLLFFPLSQGHKLYFSVLLLSYFLMPLSTFPF